MEEHPFAALDRLYSMSPVAQVSLWAGVPFANWD